MQISNLLYLTVCALISIAGMAAECRKAKLDDVPHGANEFVQLQPITVKQVHGQVFFSDTEPAKDIVVEIFRYAGNDSYKEMSKALKDKRVAACLTGPDGKFAFPRLTPGRYLLRAGTLHSMGWNEIHIVVNVDKRQPANTPLRLTLLIGT